jgi:MFS family permease
MKDTLRRRYSFFLINYFIQGSISIVYEPLDYLLKDHLKLTPGQAAGFIAWMTFPLLLKPVMGYITDFMPFRGERRKPYLILTSLIATFAFLSLAYQSHYRYLGLLIPMTLSCFALTFADVVCGGMLVEDGKEHRQTGPYQALHIGGLYLSAIVCGFGSGWMTTHLPYPCIFMVTALLPLAIFASSFIVHEEGTSRRQPRNAFQFWKFIRTRRFWALSLTIVLWNFYPFLGTVQFYYQSNVLRLNPQWIGSLMTVGAVTGLLGSAAYWKFYRGRDANTWVTRGPLAMATVSLSYLFYSGPVSVTLIEAVFGFTSVFFRLALLDLIARTCPEDAEATSYALFLVFIDVAMYGSNALGGKLFDLLQYCLGSRLHHNQIAVVILILIGSISTLACRWTLPLAINTKEGVS